jgi:hypothetical protein
MEKDGDTVYPVVAEKLIDIAEIGETVRIGIYELKETDYAEVVVKTSGAVKK